jgi:predicted nucleic acid-binding protein
MVLVDTTIWIMLYRKQRAETGEKMWMLAARNEAAVTGQIWVEFLGGFRERSIRSAYAEKLRAYPLLETTKAAFELAAELLAAHPRLGAGDAIIAATAISSGTTLWTADRDFHELKTDGLRLFS